MCIAKLPRKTKKKAQRQPSPLDLSHRARAIIMEMIASMGDLDTILRRLRSPAFGLTGPARRESDKMWEEFALLDEVLDGAWNQTSNLQAALRECGIQK